MERVKACVRKLDLRSIVIIAGSTLPSTIDVHPLLKHVIRQHFILAGTAAAHNTLYKMFSRLPIVWYSARVSLLIFI